MQVLSKKNDVYSHTFLNRYDDIVLSAIVILYFYVQARCVAITHCGGTKRKKNVYIHI